MRKLVVLLAALALIVIGITAVASAGHSDCDVTAEGEDIFEANVGVQSTFHFQATGAPPNSGSIQVQNGDTVVFCDHTGAPHTISIVADPPSTFEEALFQCFSDGGPDADGTCVKILEEHFSARHGFVPFVDVDDDGGLSEVGDSGFMFTLTGTEPFPVDVTAADGETLTYFCAIHPWMQGEIQVASP